jgi:hypothetical protein
MSKIQWEYDLVERPFCEQLKAMGWQWINGDESGLITDLLTGRVRVPERSLTDDVSDRSIG